LNEKDRKKAKKLKAIESDDEDEDEGKVFCVNSDLKSHTIIFFNLIFLTRTNNINIVPFLLQRTRKESGKSCRTSLMTTL
jgi:hypothetical protein